MDFHSTFGSILTFKPETSSAPDPGAAGAIVLTMVGPVGPFKSAFDPSGVVVIEIATPKGVLFRSVILHLLTARNGEPA